MSAVIDSAVEVPDVITGHGQGEVLLAIPRGWFTPERAEEIALNILHHCREAVAWEEPNLAPEVLCSEPTIIPSEGQS